MMRRSRASRDCAPARRWTRSTLPRRSSCSSYPAPSARRPKASPSSRTSGRFGPYVKYGAKYVSLKEDDPYTVTLERAVEVIRLKRKRMPTESLPISVTDCRYSTAATGPMSPTVRRTPRSRRTVTRSHSRSLSVGDDRACSRAGSTLRPRTPRTPRERRGGCAFRHTRGASTSSRRSTQRRAGRGDASEACPQRSSRFRASDRWCACGSAQTYEGCVGSGRAQALAGQSRRTTRRLCVDSSARTVPRAAQSPAEEGPRVGGAP